MIRKPRLRAVTFSLETTHIVSLRWSPSGSKYYHLQHFFATLVKT